MLRDVLQRQGRDRQRLGWIDFHTGLGPWGHGEKIHSGPDDAAAIARAKALVRDRRHDVLRWNVDVGGG